jgi:asparagine synthetase B (glutamine-hydrolysing)
MCGLFGFLRCPDADHPEHASQAFVLLGVLAEERGRHAAGAALLTRRAGRSPAPAKATRFPDVRLAGGCRVVKGLGPFSRVWRPELEPALDRAALALGHTRSATQGGARLANASPLAVGRLVGAHNGDVDAAPLRARFGLTAPEGETDSEAIYQALAAAGGLAARLDVLAALVGRAALAWADRARPGRVHLARAALSPLTVAVDSERNVYWASCPQWLRVAERETPVRFVTKALLAEGTYLAIEQGPRPRLVTRERFVPVARQRDRWHESAVWRGFTRADREKARALQRHVLATTRPGMVAGRVA